MASNSTSIQILSGTIPKPQVYISATDRRDFQAIQSTEGIAENYTSWLTVMR
jgi:hypothetical protein